MLGDQRGILVAGVALTILGRDEMKSRRKGANLARGNPRVQGLQWKVGLSVVGVGCNLVPGQLSGVEIGGRVRKSIAFGGPDRFRNTGLNDGGGHKRDPG